MCLYVYSRGKRAPKAKVAEKDIRCYKMVRKTDNRSAQMGFKYQPRRLYVQAHFIVGRQRNLGTHCFVGYHGFHSYATKPRRCDPRHKVVTFTIPRGARYYEGGVNYSHCPGYMSDKIKSGSLRALKV